MFRALILLLVGATIGAAAVVVINKDRTGAGPGPGIDLTQDALESGRENFGDNDNLSTAQVRAIVNHEDRLAYYTDVSRADEGQLRSLIGEVAIQAQGRQRDFAAEVLLLKLAETDPRGALALSRDLGLRRDVTASIFAVWAGHDIDAALDAFSRIENVATASEIGLALLDDLGGDDATLAIVVDALPPGLSESAFRIDVLALRAGSDPDYALSEALAIANTADRMRALGRVAAVIAEQDPALAMSMGAEIADRTTRQGFQQRVLREWADADPEAALAFFNDPGLSNEDAMALSGSIFSRIGRADPERLIAASENWSALLRDRALSYAIRSWSEKDALSASVYVQSLPPGRKRDNYMSTVARGYGQQDPHAALAWAEQLQPRPRGIYRSIVSTIAQDDPDAAFEIALGLNATEDRQQAFQAVVMDSVNLGGGGTKIADKVLAMEPGTMRDQSLQLLGMMWVHRDPETAVGWMVANSNQLTDEFVMSFASRFAENDPLAAATFTDRIPAESRAGWIRQVAKGYAQFDSEAAANWLSQYQGQPGYDDGMVAIGQLAAQQDPVRAAQLVANYTDPRHATMMAATIGDSWAQQDPESAARWAESLEHDQARSAAVTNVAGQWADRDPFAAKSWADRLPKGPMRDAALTSIVPFLARRENFDESIFDAFSSDTVRQQAAVRTIYVVARLDDVAARRLMDRYVSDPTLRAQLEQYMSSSTLW